MNPFYSIIIPVYNCEKTITETLSSVLFQTFIDYEVIIVNDCSTDKSLSLIHDFKSNFHNITIINNHKNIGVAESRNMGILNSKGKYIAFLDADDVWMPNKLEKQFNEISSTDCDICCSSYSFIDESSQKIKNTYKIPRHIDYKMLLKENFIGCSTAVIKKALLKNNLMNKEYQHEDYALWLKLLRNGATVIGISEPLMNYRILKNSRSFNKTNAAKGRMSIYRNQEKLNLFSSLYYFSYYTINGVKKRLL